MKKTLSDYANKTSDTKTLSQYPGAVGRIQRGWERMEQINREQEIRAELRERRRKIRRKILARCFENLTSVLRSRTSEEKL
jgi:hypothetical protein